MDALKGGLILCTNANDMVIGVIPMQEGMVIVYRDNKFKQCMVELSSP